MSKGDEKLIDHILGNSSWEKIAKLNKRNASGYIAIDCRTSDIKIELVQYSRELYNSDVILIRKQLIYTGGTMFYSYPYDLSHTLAMVLTVKESMLKRVRGCIRIVKDVGDGR